MKKLHLYCLIAIVTLTVFYSCKSRQEKDLVNYWKLVGSRNTLRDSLKIAYFTNITFLQNTIDTINNDKEKESLEADLAKRKYILNQNDSLFDAEVAASFLEIKEDGLYDCNLFDTKEAGNWKFKKDSSVLITIPVGQKEDKLKVLHVNKDTLILGEDDNNCMVFVASPKK